MKKLVLALSLIIGSFSLLQAQDAVKKEARFRHHRIYFGASAYDMINKTAISHKVPNYTIDSSGTGGGMLGYEYKFNKRFSLALEFGANVSGVYYLNDTNSKQDLLTGYLNSYGLLKARYTWLYRPWKKSFFRMYSGAGVGMTQTLFFKNEVELPGIPKEDGTNFSYQIDAVGAEISFSWFGLWLEAGYGNQGNLRAGMSFNFKK